MPIYIMDPAGNRRAVNQPYVIDSAGNRRTVQAGYIMDPAGNRRQFYQSLPPNVLNTTLAAGTDGNFIGFRRGIIGSINPNMYINGGLLEEWWDYPGVNQFQIRFIGCVSNPGQTFFTSVTTANGNSYLTNGSGGLSYTYNGGTATWQWTKGPNTYVAGNNYAVGLVL